MNTCKESCSPPANTYHGLKNQGATCYLNSVLQVLFMTKEFREAVKRKKSETEHIDLQLTTLFDDLTKCTAQTHKITQKLGINRVHEQRDAAEYFEKILRHTSPEASQIFQGQLTHKNICLKCHTETDTDGPVWSLPLALKDSHSDNYRVVDGIKEFFKASDVSGDNQMYCDECDDKVDATMKCVMKHHPEVLVLLLKRFEFDYHYMENVKISRSVDVPCTLKIPEKKTYELYGFVDHFGDLRGGHYTATIKCQDDKRWYNFNDTMVTRSSLQMDNIMKSRTAYLLFYRKKTVKAADTFQDIRKMSTNGGFQSDTSHSNEPCDVKTRKRKEDEEAAEGHLYHGDKQKNNKKRKADDQQGKQEQESVFVDKQRVEKLVKDVKVHQKSTTGVNEREKASVSGKPLTKYHLFYGFPNNEGVDDSKKNMSNNQGISNTSLTRHYQQQREEKNDVKKDKKQITREIKHTVTGDISMIHRYSRNLGDVRQEQRSRQNSLVRNRSANDFRQNKPNYVQEGKQQRYLVEKQREKSDGKGHRQRRRGDNECTQRRGMSGSHGSEGVEDKPQEQLKKESGHKDVGVETSVKVEEIYNRHIQNRKESFRQTQSAGSRDLTENQRVNSGQLTPCEQGKGEFSLKAEHESKKKKHRKGRKSLLNFFSCGLLKRKKKRDRSSESE